MGTTKGGRGRGRVRRTQGCRERGAVSSQSPTELNKSSRACNRSREQRRDVPPGMINASTHTHIRRSKQGVSVSKLPVPQLERPWERARKGRSKLTTSLEILLGPHRHTHNLPLAFRRGKLITWDTELVDQVDVLDKRALEGEDSDRVGEGDRHLGAGSGGEGGRGESGRERPDRGTVWAQKNLQEGQEETRGLKNGEGEGCVWEAGRGPTLARKGGMSSRATFGQGTDSEHASHMDPAEIPASLCFEGLGERDVEGTVDII